MHDNNTNDERINVISDNIRTIIQHYNQHAEQLEQAQRFDIDILNDIMLKFQDANRVVVQLEKEKQEKINQIKHDYDHKIRMHKEDRDGFSREYHNVLSRMILHDDSWLNEGDTIDTVAQAYSIEEIARNINQKAYTPVIDAFDKVYHHKMIKSIQTQHIDVLTQVDHDSYEDITHMYFTFVVQIQDDSTENDIQTLSSILEPVCDNMQKNLLDDLQEDQHVFITAVIRNSSSEYFNANIDIKVVKEGLYCIDTIRTVYASNPHIQRSLEGYTSRSLADIFLKLKEL